MSPRRTYDHRIREAIVTSGDPNLFPELNIPPSTTRTWLREGSRAVVGFSDNEIALRVQLARLERQVRILREVVRLLLARKRASGATLDHQRLPDGAKKQTLLRAIRRASAIMPLKAALRILGWRVEQRLNPLNTFEVLSDAAFRIEGPAVADVVMDAGVENLNRTVDGLFDSGQLRRVLLAQVCKASSKSAANRS